MSAGAGAKVACCRVQVRRRDRGPRGGGLRAIACERRLGGYAIPMKLLRGAAALSAAKMAYDQARKPENQAKLKSAVAKARESRTRRRK